MVKQVIVVRTDLKMTAGKACSQAAHAAMLFILAELRERREGGWGDFTPQQWEWMHGKTKIPNWMFGPMKTIVVTVPGMMSLDLIGRAAWKAGIISMTCIDETLKVPTCIAVGPDEDEKIDEITGHLPKMEGVIS